MTTTSSGPAPVTDDPETAAWRLRNLDPEGFREAVDALPDGPVTTFLRARLARVDGRDDVTLRLCDEAEPLLPPGSLWQARLLELRGLVLDELGLPEPAQQMLEQALRIYDERQDLAGRAGIRHNLASRSFQPPSTCQRLHEESLALAQEAGLPDLEGVILLSMQRALIRRDDTVAERERLAHRAAGLLRDSWPEMAQEAGCWLVWAALERGDVEAARTYGQNLPDPLTVRPQVLRAVVADARLDVALATGEGVDEAVSDVRAVLELPQTPAGRFALQRNLAIALRSLGRVEEAYDACYAALEQHTDVNLRRAETAARALDSWHRTQRLQQERQREAERADALESALRQLQEAHERVRELMIRDPLTGLHNRQHLLEVGTAAILRSSAECPAQVALIDLDKFKRINDTRGHQAGDEVLREFAALLVDELPASDLVARYGGEEFVVVRPPGATPEECGSLADDLERLRVRARTIRPRGETRPDVRAVSLSVGVVVVHGTDLAEALGAADAVMYAAKHDGGDRVYHA